VGRPKLPETMEILSVRLPARMVKEIDAYIEEQRREMPLLPVNKADVVRELIALGLGSRRKKGKRIG
jgi:Arc/MetJ-type ribon-helix-helix transcriptional regulator